MICPECDRNVTESRCVCGWKAPALMSDESRRYQGMTLCSWRTAGQLCNMLANVDRPLCNWHHEWQRQLESQPMITEFDALCEWMQQFEPGGDYGANPGQWWATPEQTIQVCHGFGYLPGRTEKQKYERYQEHWKMMEKLKKGIYSEKTQALMARTRGDALKPAEVLEQHK